jgi:hypothetical protein
MMEVCSRQSGASVGEVDEMAVRVIQWNGAEIPEGLRDLPPGRYVVEAVDDVPPLTAEEDAGLAAPLDELDAGESVPLAVVVRRLQRRTGVR